jgi:filamentous hemagglutinin family protein
MKVTFSIFALISVVLTSVSYNSGVHAKVTPDSTLKTTVTGGNNYTITNGNRVGNNLFHSFSEFSIPTNGSAFFDNANDIQNIFSRVTGGNLSNIDGLIQANGSANLFLLNPSGIIFGANARLDIGGSFVGTTGNSIKFADGTEFSAVNASSSPLLTMSVPIGLQMGQDSGAITVQGLGHRIIPPFSVAQELDLSNNPTGLQVKAGNTLALIGSGLNFAGGIVAADGGGHIEIGSINHGLVRLNSTVTGWKGDYSQVEQFNDIHLAQQSLLDASGSNGSIQLQGQNINLTEGSTVVIQNLGTQSQGITVHATGSLNLTGYTPDQKQGSIIAIENLGTSSSGDLVVSANQLFVQDGGQIQTFTPTAAASGNISIDVEDLIYLNGFIPTNPTVNTKIITITDGSGKAGDITISSGNLRVFNGASLISVTMGYGEGGAMQINAKDLIEIVGNNPIILVPSAISSATIGTGNANSILVNTSRLILRDGGVLGSNTLSQGRAGNVTVNASDFLEVSGKAPGSIRSSNIMSSSEILDQVVQETYGLPSIPTGDAGSLTINTPSLRISDSAFVSVKNDGPGRAGDLQINANLLFLYKEGSISASTASGNGGDIQLNLQDYLLMYQDSVISATAQGNGNGGNLSINSPVIVGLENSDIIANAVQGRGGNINISTQNIIGLEFRDILTPRTVLTNDITASSQFNVNGTVQINNISIIPSSGLVELPANITDPSQQIAIGCADTSGSSFVATGRGGIPQNPTQEVRSDKPWSDVRDLSSYRTTAQLQAQVLQSRGNLIQATSWHRNSQGKIELVVDKSSMSMQPSLTCVAVPKS